MNYRKFGKLGWNVSEIGLGCWQIGWCWGEVTDSEARKILKTALDKGVNFFDTSDTYGDGRSEKFLSEIISGEKNNIYVTTKLGRRIRGTNYARGYKPNAMEEFVDRSLKNLRVEKIDLVQMHCPPIEVCENADTYETMDRLVEKGKIGAYGISIYNLSEGYAALKNENVQSVQLVFNMFRQKPLDDFLQHAKEKNVAIIARGPLASGLLSGEITENSVFPENDHRNYNIDGSAFDIGDTFSGIPLKHGCRAVEEVKKLLPKSMTVSQLALRWILMHKEISTVIPGAVTAKQVEANSGISHLPEIQDLMGRIGSIYNNFLRSEVHEKWN